MPLWRKEMVDNIRYEIILYWSKEDQAFLAEVPELPGCGAPVLRRDLWRPVKKALQRLIDSVSARGGRKGPVCTFFAAARANKSTMRSDRSVSRSSGTFGSSARTARPY